MFHEPKTSFQLHFCLLLRCSFFSNLSDLCIIETMRSSEAASPSCRSKKHNLRSSKTQSLKPLELSTKTPEKIPERTRRRTRNRGVALSVSDVVKVAEGLQERRNRERDATSSQPKTARKQLELASPRKPQTNADEEEEPFKLPDKYEILGEFFDQLNICIPLLRRQGSTFTNISPMVERLTNRRFTHRHLAQLKFILPEVIDVKKIVVFDERTYIAKPDLHVSINRDAIESDTMLKPEREGVSLSKLFRERLRDFCKSHPEVDEIPEETLPEPFNYRKQDCLLKTFRTPSSSLPTVISSAALATPPPTLSSTCMQDNDTADNAELAHKENDLTDSAKTSTEALNQKLAIVSHISQSFKPRFSQKSIQIGAEKQKLLSNPLHSVTFSGSESSLKKNAPFLGSESHPKTCTVRLASEASSSEICPTISATSESIMQSGAPPATRSKTNESIENDGSLKSTGAMSTPAKPVSTPSKLMSATPALAPPKRHYLSPDVDSSGSPSKLVRRPSLARSLKFDTPKKNNEDGAGGLSIDDDTFDILPEDLLQSISEKEIMAMKERDPAISQAKRRQKMIAKLPKLFNMIHLMFQSINRSVITKEELLSKIISSRLDIVYRREVEEQLKLLLELVPEWISEKLASSGDYLMCINKMVNPETIRTSLEEAKRARRDKRTMFLQV